MDSTRKITTAGDIATLARLAQYGAATLGLDVGGVERLLAEYRRQSRLDADEALLTQLALHAVAAAWRGAR
jgi:hypothetical protein